MLNRIYNGGVFEFPATKVVGNLIFIIWIYGKQ